MRLIVRIEDPHHGHDQAFEVSRSVSTLAEAEGLVRSLWNYSQEVIAQEKRLVLENTSTARRVGLIQMIKAYRETTGVGLKEAKEAVERALARNGLFDKLSVAQTAALREKFSELGIDVLLLGPDEVAAHEVHSS